MLAVNFIDGRWPKTAQEPESKIKEVLGDAEQFCLKSDPFFIQLIYLTSAMRLWTNALNSIHDQLIAYVSAEEISCVNGTFLLNPLRKSASRTMRKYNLRLRSLFRIPTELYMQ